MKVGAGSGCSYSTLADAVYNAEHNSGYTTIYIATNQSYTNQAIVITTTLGSHITLVGGVPNCSTLTPAGTTTLNGSASASVITVRGTMTLTLSHLTISGGHGSSGGGIDYAAVGALHLDTSTVEYNTANNGGGIRFQGNGGAADLYLHSNTLIDNNTATNGGSGGGLRVEGNATLHADEPNTWIGYNLAADKGGGIIVIGPATAHIGSIGLGGLGVITDNTANYGGGIAAFSASTGWATIDVFAVDPNHPVRIERNRAYHTGGGIYIEPYGFGGMPVSADLGGAQIDSNAAQEGSGIYVDYDGWNERGELHVQAGHCAAGIECNTVSNNRAVATDSQGHETSTEGSAILLQSYAWATIDQLAMRGNQGAHVIRVADSLNSPLMIDTCLIADNIIYAELIALGNASATINQCTIANNHNVAEGYAIVRANADLTLSNSIFAQGSQQTLLNTNAGASMTVNYVISGETASLGPGTNVVHADPRFVDPVNGDFHLQANSPAIDFAPAGNASDRDLDNLPRDQDLISVPNLDGPRDLGAYELQSAFSCGASDTLFCNGFEAP